MSPNRSLVLSVVIPIFNEEDILWDNLKILAPIFDEIIGPERWCFVLVDNNSTDKTPEIIERAVGKWPPSRTVFEPVRNYGRALKAGMNSVDTPWAMIVDVEQWDIPFIYWAWANRERYDVFLGSKRADPTLNRQSFYRNLLSWGLNSLIQLLFVFPGQDTHGPKLLRMGVIGDLLPLCMSERGQYDTEIVLRALGAGARLVEAPIGYIETRPPRNLMVSKIFFNIIGFVKIYIQLRSLPIKGPLQFHRFSRDDILAKCLPIDFVNSGGDLHRNKP